MSLSIDCPPGQRRPDVVLLAMCQTLGLATDMFVTESRFFGEWTWRVSSEYRGAYVMAIPAIENHLVALYGEGVIRYAEW